MRAATIEENELVLQERPDPEVGPGMVLVQLAAAGINAADLLQRKGFYPAPPGAPADIPGLELAGIVTSCAEDATLFKPGDRVMGIVGGGGQAELCAIHETNLLRVPDTLPFEEAGGFAEAFITAHDALVTRGGLNKDSRVLITGAAGGVGTAAVQIAALFGAHVVASVRDPARRPSVEALGATVAVDPAEVDKHGPYDVVLELVGAASLSAGVLDTLAPEASIVVIGVGGGSRLEVDLLKLMNARASLSGATLRARSVAEKAAATDAVRRDLLEPLTKGRLTVPILETFEFSNANEAYARFEEGSKFGKIVLTFP